MTKTTRSFLLFAVAMLCAVAVLQLIPYGRNHANPAIVREPPWDSTETRILAKRACFNCHSFETAWPWYARIAPASWLVWSDVNGGRRELNFSDWRFGKRAGERSEKIREEVSEGEMPPFIYRLAHPEARLAEGEKRRLMDGLAATTVRR